MSKFFSLAYLTLPNTHPVDQIEIAAQCGYEGVGLRTISQHLPGEPDYALANGRMFQICLLYTSPSPRDRSVSRMPSSA